MSTISVTPETPPTPGLKGTTWFVEEPPPPPSKGGQQPPKTRHRMVSKDKGAITPTAVYIAGNTSTNLNVILWFHGFHVADYWHDIFVEDQMSGQTKLRENVDLAAKNVVLIVPWLGYKTFDKNGNTVGSLDAPEVNQKQDYALYLKAVLDELKSAAALETTNVDRLVIACHSGSGPFMMDAADALGDKNSSFKDQVKECWGYDCIYGDMTRYTTWMDKHHAQHSLFFYLGTGSSYNRKQGATRQFRDLWTFAYGTPGNPKKPALDKVFLAPATTQPVGDLECFSDNQVFATYDGLLTKDPTLLSTYERWRKNILDPLLDTDPTRWDTLVHASVKEHYHVVQDLLAQRVADMLNDHKLAGAGKFIAQCHADGMRNDPPPAKKSTTATAGKKQ
jgi:hypothetical protein